MKSTAATPSPHTSVELENRAAFVVQLNGLLTQVSLVVSHDGLSSSAKAKLADVRSGLEEWVREIGPVGAQRPSIVPPSTADARQAATKNNGQSPQPAEGTSGSEEVGEVKREEAVETPNGSTSASQLDVAAASAEGTAALSASTFGSKTIVDLADFISLLFAAGLPESNKLRVFGRAMARLVMVRCSSTVMAALQHLLFNTYKTVAPSRAAEPVEGRHPRDDRDGHAKDTCFVHLSRDIRRSTRALLTCLDIVTFNADLADISGCRFPVQMCLDALRQVRRTMHLFQLRVEREELALVRRHPPAARPSESTKNADLVNSPTGQSGLPEVMNAHVQARVAALQALWGPSLMCALSNVGQVVSRAVSFLVSVASISEAGASAELVQLKLDVQSDLFSFADGNNTTSPSSRAPAVQSPNAQPEVFLDGGGSSSSVPPEGKAVEEPAEAVVESRPSQQEAEDESGTAQWRVAVASILYSLDFSFSADYTAAVASCCGDANDGGLVATRIVTDSLREVAEAQPALLRRFIAQPKWKKWLFNGILSCLVSLQPAVLKAGLEDLRIIVSTCADALGQEVGYVYSMCVFRLLESDNCPHYVKREILLHLLRTIIKDRETPQSVPLMLRLYCTYDLNVHAHQLNVVQQLIAALSKIVRRAPQQEFLQDVAAQRQLLLSQQAEAGEQDGTAASADEVDFALMQQSLPLMALHGLVLAVELLTTQTPLEDDSGHSVLALLPSLRNRDRKVEEQRLVDVFNSSPKKGIQRIFGVTDAEMHPPGSADFLSSCDRTKLPAPQSNATRAKIAAVVDFLLDINSLNPESVAEYLTTPAVFTLQVCDAYMQRLALAGRSVIEALGELLGLLQLPKEGQRIERLLEYFCYAYFWANRVDGVDRSVFPFLNSDACFIVVVATVMLNTDLHNPQANSRMSRKSFRAQLKGCNDGKSFSDDFVDDIFMYISHHPLNNAKSVGAATLSGSPHNSTAVEPPRGIDALFISNEERRQLAFGLERQRLVSETRELLQRRSGPPTAFNDGWTWWSAVARDFFLSAWSSICAVFGPAMYEGVAVPTEVLLQCIKGLKALLCVAAAFALSTECEVTLLTLLRLCVYEPVRDLCRRAVLLVATTSYSIHFSSRCWLSVVDLMVTLRMEDNTLLAEVEGVLTRVETFTRVSCEPQSTPPSLPHDQASAAANTEAVDAAALATATADTPTTAVRRILAGVLSLLENLSVGDAESLSAGLYILRRALGYSLITHTGLSSGVVHFVNIHDFNDAVLPRLVVLVTACAGSEESLRLLVECVVDLLGLMWSAYASKHHAVARAAPTTAAAPSPPADADDRPQQLVDCYDFFKLCYISNGSSTLVKMHLLQGVKELVLRTLRAVEAGSVATTGGCHVALYTIISVWRRMLYPLASALADRESTATEARSLAVLVLRKLVVACSGTGSSAANRIPTPIRSALLMLLANVAYIGGICSDVDSAQACLAQLSTICTAALSLDKSISGANAGAPLEPSPAHDADAPTQPRGESSRLVYDIIRQVETQPDLVVLHTLERLCMLLRCERDQTRAEAIESLRTLSLQFHAVHVRYLAVRLAGVVLEGTKGRPNRGGRSCEVPLSDPMLISFWFLGMEVPTSLRLCSRTAFRTTLPAALGFLTNELLTASPVQELGAIAEVVMQRCLVPIVLSPTCGSFQSRSLAARSLTQCAMLCLSRHAAASSSGEPCNFPLAVVLNCVGIILSGTRVALRDVVPEDAPFAGKDWAATVQVAGFVPYLQRAAAALEALAAADPDGITGTVAGASILVAPPDARETTAEASPAQPKDEGIVASEEAAAASRAPPALTRDWRARESVEMVTDAYLTEYGTLLVQVLSGLPKILSTVPCGVSGGPSAKTAAAAATAGGWSPPPVTSSVLTHLLLEAVSVLFAALWRVNHPQEMERFMAQLVPTGREPQATTKSNALLPHAAVRGALNSYLELALRDESYSLDHVLRVAVTTLTGICEVQAATTFANGVPLKGLSGSAMPPEAGAQLAAVQRLSPQEQQHVRTCNVGMYQELSVVLSYWVRALIRREHHASLSAERLAAVEAMAATPEFFGALVQLLSPTAGSLILTVRDYFTWYNAHQAQQQQRQRLSSPPPATGGAQPHLVDEDGSEAS